jgi:hypothetical protein
MSTARFYQVRTLPGVEEKNGYIEENMHLHKYFKSMSLTNIYSFMLYDIFLLFFTANDTVKKCPFLSSNFSAMKEKKSSSFPLTPKG